MDIDQLRRAYSSRAKLLREINLRCPWLILHNRHSEAILEVITSLVKVSWPDQPLMALDVAGGTGVSSMRLLKKGFSVTYCDILPEMVDHVSTTFGPQVAKGLLTPVLSSAETIAQRVPVGCTVVNCTQASNFFPDIELFFAAAKDYLPKGGYLYFDLDTPYRWSLISFLEGRLDVAESIISKNTDSYHWIVGTDYYFYPRELIFDLLARTGFEILASYSFCHFSTYLHCMNKSQDFLTDHALSPVSQLYTSEGYIERLLNLERSAPLLSNHEAAGYWGFLARSV